MQVERKILRINKSPSTPSANPAPPARYVALGYLKYLQQDLVMDAQELAMECSRRYSKEVQRRNSPYHQNTAHSHFIGKVGEMGSSLIFEDLGLVPVKNFLDSQKDVECDIVIEGVRIEVKCWSPHPYKLYGACIADKQAQKLHKKMDAVIYCTFSSSDSSFIIRGWNTMLDIQETPKEWTGPWGKQVLNRKMHPRDILELSTILKGEKAQETITAMNQTDRYITKCAVSEIESTMGYS